MSVKFNLKYVLFLFVAVFLSCFFHEFAHWLTGEILGNKMSMSLNGASPVSGEYIEKWHANIITIAAPIFTVLQGVFFYFYIDKVQNINVYPFLFFPFVYRFSAGVANVFGANDEGRFGLSFGLGLYTVSIIFSVFLLFLIVSASKKQNIGLKFNLLTFLLCAVSLLLVVLIDQYFKIEFFG